VIRPTLLVTPDILRILPILAQLLRLAILPYSALIPPRITLLSIK
jgi:hypothetical protein